MTHHGLFVQSLNDVFGVVFRDVIVWKDSKKRSLTNGSSIKPDTLPTVPIFKAF